MCLYNVTAKHLPCANTTIVWSLGSWEAALGPAEGMTICVKESVLLFNSEPRNGVLLCGKRKRKIFIRCIYTKSIQTGIPSHNK